MTLPTNNTINRNSRMTDSQKTYGQIAQEVFDNFPDNAHWPWESIAQAVIHEFTTRNASLISDSPADKRESWECAIRTLKRLYEQVPKYSHVFIENELVANLGQIIRDVERLEPPNVPDDDEDDPLSTYGQLLYERTTTGDVPWSDVSHSLKRRNDAPFRHTTDDIHALMRQCTPPSQADFEILNKLIGAIRRNVDQHEKIITPILQRIQQINQLEPNLESLRTRVAELEAKLNQKYATTAALLGDMQSNLRKRVHELERIYDGDADTLGLGSRMADAESAVTRFISDIQSLQNRVAEIESGVVPANAVVGTDLLDSITGRPRDYEQSVRQNVDDCRNRTQGQTQLHDDQPTEEWLKYAKTCGPQPRIGPINQ